MIAYILPLLASVLFVISNVEGIPIDQALLYAVENPGELDYDVKSDLVKVELDMLFKREEYDFIQRTGRKKRAAGIKDKRWSSRRWDLGNVYYEFSGNFTHKEKTEIEDAMKAWAKYTCLFFSLATSASNRIQFKDGKGCSSNVGMIGGLQTIYLARGCRSKLIIIHEIGHALGLYHEQTRPDRDEHVTVLEKNVPPSMRFNFDLKSWNVILDMGVPYDYRSIMHYSKGAFSMNGQDTIRTKDRSYQDIIGNAFGLSFADVKTINTMYNCKRQRPYCFKNDNQCPRNGYVGKDCQCWCPADLNDRHNFESARRCSDTRVRPRPTPRPVTPRPSPPECKDVSLNCHDWVDEGFCKSTGYLLCKKSCKHCEG